MATKKNKTCPDCLKSIWSSSTRCRICSKKGVLNSFYGKTHSAETKLVISKKTTKENPSYGAIHLWVKSKKGVAQKCSHCGITRDQKRIEWANKDHKYSRNIDDFFELCTKCHLNYDVEHGFKDRIWAKTAEERHVLAMKGVFGHWHKV